MGSIFTQVQGQVSSIKDSRAVETANLERPRRGFLVRRCLARPPDPAVALGRGPVSLLFAGDVPVSTASAGFRYLAHQVINAR